MITVNHYRKVGNSYVNSGNSYTLFSIDSIMYATRASASQSELSIVYFADNSQFVTDLAGINELGANLVSINEYKRTATTTVSKLKDTGVPIKVNAKNVANVYPFGIGYETDGVTEIDCYRVRLSNGKVIITDEAGVNAIDGIEAKYKVYTALLTQSGDGNLESIINSPLVIGRTYQIDNDGVPSGIWDFTNVGAPNNDIGTYFIATGTTPNNWGTNIVLGYTNGAPVVTVLENTIGNVWFTYDVDGQYYCYSNIEFELNKTFVITGKSTEGLSNNAYAESRVEGGAIVINAGVFNVSNSNDQLNNTPIEIRVYY